MYKEREEFIGQKTIFRWAIIEVFRKQLSYTSMKDEIIFRSDEEVKSDPWESHGMNREFSVGCTSPCARKS